MIEITRTRDGTQTIVTAICPTHEIAIQAEGIYNRIARIVNRKGSIIRTRCNRSEADQLVAALERLSYRTSPAVPAAPLPAGIDNAGRRRELIQATPRAEAEARNHPPAVNGRALIFTGFGEEFIGREIHGHLWGERVRYAYYVRAED